MLTKIFAYINLAIFFVAGSLLSGCNAHQATGQELVGRWEHDGHVYEFKTDGMVSYDDSEYSFTANDGSVTIDKNGESVTFDYLINTNGTLSMNGLTYYPVRKGRK